MESHQISISDLENYIEFVDKKKPEKIENSFIGSCPKCKEPLMIYNISIPKGRSNIYGYKSRWFCKVCLWEKYEKKNYT